MAKTVSVYKKTRGRPATGQDPVSAVRLPSDLTDEIDVWGEKHKIATRSEAIRRLVELGLATGRKPARRRTAKNAEKAKELAAKMIDGLEDATAPAEERASRKRRLLKGPEEFREVRVDRPKKR